MIERIRAKLSYANVMATVATFLALGGGAWAVARDSVGSREIKRNAVKSQEIAKDAVAGAEVRAGAVGSEELKDGSVRGQDIDEASLGTVPSAQTAESAYTKAESDGRFFSNSNAPLGAFVGPGGTLERGIGAVSSSRTSAGRYTVVFNRDVRDCIYSANLGGVSAFEPDGVTQVTSLSSDERAVGVDTQTLAGANQDLAFYLVVVC